MRIETQISTGDTTVIMNTIGRYIEGFIMGKEEWDAIKDIRDEVMLMKGKMSVLMPILIISIGSFLASIGALFVAIMVK